MTAKPITFARAKSIVIKARSLQLGDGLYTVGVDDGYVEVFQCGFPDPLFAFSKGDEFYIERDGTLTIVLDAGGIYNFTVLAPVKLKA